MRVLELFCGAGGLGAGFAESGFDIVGAYDHNRDAVDTYQANLGHAQVKDLSTFTFRSERPEVDVLVGGPPCQGFSIANQRKHTKDPRNHMIQVFIDAVRDIQPDCFLMEQVPLFQKTKHYQHTIKTLSQHYRIKAQVLQADWYGASTSRKRLFTVGWANRTPSLPAAHSTGKTVRDVIGDLPPAGPVSTPRHRFSRTPTRDLHVRYSTDDPRMSLAPADGSIPTPDIISEMGFRRPSGSGDSLARIRWDQPVGTLICRPQWRRMRAIHPEHDRHLTLRELALLQGFPDSWMWTGSRSSIAAQIGNSVPLQMSRAIADHIKTTRQKHR